MGEGYYAGVSSDANSDAEAPEKPLRLTKAWRRGRVPLSCTHWNKRKALPLLKLRRFLAMPVPAFNPFAPTLGTIVDQEKDAQAWYAGLKKKKRHYLRGKSYMESKAMGREDGAGILLRRIAASEERATNLQKVVRVLQEEADRLRETTVASRPSKEPRFRAGQSVLQW